MAVRGATVGKTGAIVGWDDTSRSTFSNAPFCREQYGAFEDFSPSMLTSTTTYPGYTVTVITAGTLVMLDRVGGWLSLVGGGADGQGIQMQTDGEMFIPAANKDIWFEASIELTVANDTDWFVGLASTDTNLFSTDPTDIIAFRGDDGDANIDFQVRKAGTGAQTDTTADAANNTAVRLGFHVNGVTSVTPYINGTRYTAVTANIPIVEMTISFGMLDGATTGNDLLIDYYRAVQVR